MTGNPESYAFDNEISSAIINLQGKAREGSRLVARLTQDEVRTLPLKHQEASKLAGRLIESAEGLQKFLERKAKEYVDASSRFMNDTFTPNPQREGVYIRAADWIAREAKNGEGNGYKAIREAVTEEPDFAIAIYNTNWRLLGLPKQDAMEFAEKAVKAFAPQALDYIEKSNKLDQLAKRYPAFIAQVRSSYFSTFELAKVRTYVELPT